MCTAVGEASQEPCFVNLMDHERCVRKWMSHNHVTASQLIRFRLGYKRTLSTRGFSVTRSFVKYSLVLGCTMSCNLRFFWLAAPVKLIMFDLSGGLFRVEYAKKKIFGTPLVYRMFTPGGKELGNTIKYLPPEIYCKELWRQGMHVCFGIYSCRFLTEPRIKAN